jgi:peroxiredoxin
LTLPYLDRLTPGTVQVIAISQDEENATTRFQKTFGGHMTTLLDRERHHYPVSNAFGISHVPALFLVEQDRTISMASEGFVKRDLEAVAQRAGVAMFGPGDHVPEWKPG